MSKGSWSNAALRLLQKHPGYFCSAIAIGARLPASDIDPKTITNPVYLLNDPGEFSGTDSQIPYLHRQAKNFVQTLKRAGIANATFDDLPVKYFDGDPETQAQVFVRMAAFLNLVNTNATVNLGPLQIIKDAPATPR